MTVKKTAKLTYTYLHHRAKQHNMMCNLRVMLQPYRLHHLEMFLLRREKIEAWEKAVKSVSHVQIKFHAIRLYFCLPV